MKNKELKYEEVLAMAQANIVAIKEMGKRQDEYFAAEEKRRQKEEKRRQKEEKRRLKEKKAEEERQLKEKKAEAELRKIERVEYEEKRDAMDKRIAESNSKADKVFGQFTTMWGKLVESLVNGDIVKLLNQRGIQITRTAQRIKGCINGRNFELDIVAYNGPIIVIIEVKTTLTPTDVQEFIDVLHFVKKNIAEFADKIIYGGMAFIETQGHSDLMVINKGMLCIKATGSSANIINPIDFIPKSIL